MVPRKVGDTGVFEGCAALCLSETVFVRNDAGVVQLHPEFVPDPATGGKKKNPEFGKPQIEPGAVRLEVVDTDGHRRIVDTDLLD